MGKTQSKDNGSKAEFLQSVKEQLYEETFQADVPEYSHETVEALVKIIDVAEGVDEEEAEKGYSDFVRNFSKITAGSKKKAPRSRCRRFARGAVAVLALLLAADITSQAVMDKGLFHMMEVWKNQLIVMPGETEPEELTNFRENETVIFSEVEEFADFFGEEFFVCGWLPEEVKLKEIIVSKSRASYNYLWEYEDAEKNNIIIIRMYEKTDNDIAGLTGTQIDNCESSSFDNGIIAHTYRNNDRSFSGFEFNGWWYIISSIENENTMKSILGGMILYE